MKQKNQRLAYGALKKGFVDEKNQHYNRKDAA